MAIQFDYHRLTAVKDDEVGPICAVTLNTRLHGEYQVCLPERVVERRFDGGQLVETAADQRARWSGVAPARASRAGRQCRAELPSHWAYLSDDRLPGRDDEDLGTAQETLDRGMLVDHRADPVALDIDLRRRLARGVVVHVEKQHLAHLGEELVWVHVGLNPERLTQRVDECDVVSAEGRLLGLLDQRLLDVGPRMEQERHVLLALI